VNIHDHNDAKLTRPRHWQ